MCLGQAVRPNLTRSLHLLRGMLICQLKITTQLIRNIQDHVVFEGKGIVLAEDEGCDIAKDLGDKKAALLRNHGLLTVGQTIEEAVFWFYTLDKACHVQLLADAAAQGRGGETNKISNEEAEYTRGVAGKHKAGWMGGVAMFDLIEMDVSDVR